nr:efflux RND transporter periplasmic adaptor subunit [Caldimonas sp.]
THESATPQAPKPPQVTVANLQTREITDYDEYNGYLDSAKTVEVRARVRGHLQKVHFKDGQLVKAGDLLFELDPRPFQADVERAEAIVTALKAQQDAASKEKTRQESLLGRGGASQSLVDKLTADVLALGAQVTAQEKEVSRLKLDLEYSRITAAIDGKIGRALLTEGNLVNAGGEDPLLATIVSLDPIYLFFTVDERALQLYRKRAGSQGRAAGDKLAVAFNFGLDTDKGFPRQGTLDFGDVKVDPGTGTITVRGTVANADGELIPGSRAKVRIAVGDARKAAIVPDRAILADQDRRYVLVVDDKNVVGRRDVQLGKLLDDGSREVTPRDPKDAAFTGKDRIVVEGLLRARLHQPVEPLDAAARRPEDAKKPDGSKKPEAGK